MNAQLGTFPKSKTHPSIIIAGIAVVLFCTAGTAAIMGWLPSSIGSNKPVAATMTEPVAVVAAPVKSQAATGGNTSTHTQRVVTKADAKVAAPTVLACSSCGVVESTRAINTPGSGSGVGAAGGAVVGGLLGNQVGGGRGQDIMTVVGAIGGAVAGNQIEAKVKTTHSYEVAVRMEDGTTRAIAQATQPTWRAGDRVKIVDGVLKSNA